MTPPINSLDPESVSAPRSDKPILEDIHNYLKEKDFDMTDYEVVEGALHALWPEIYRNDTLATFLVTVNVYLKLAEKYGFEVKPAYLAQAKMEGMI